MSDIADTDIAFDGINGITGDILVRTIRRRVLAERIHDDDWLIALTAGSYFQGPALDWYEDQTDETQENWKLLRRAILTRWPSSTGSQATAHAFPTSKVPIPAAASPISATVAPNAASPVPIERSALQDIFKRGRIRVQYEDGSYVGYLSTVLSDDGNCQVTSDKSNTAIVRFTPKGLRHDIEIITPGSDVVKLGVTLAAPNFKKHLINERLTWGNMVNITGDDRQSSISQTGPWCSNVWSIFTDGKIMASWETKPNIHRDLTFRYKSIIGFTTDFKGFQEIILASPIPAHQQVAHGQKIVRLFFEPL